MADPDPKDEYKQSFMERVTAAREARDLSQQQVADALGIPQDTYKQYEGHSLLPHHLIGRFCIICQVDVAWLITGHGKKTPPAKLPPPTALKPAARKSRPTAI